MTKREFTTQLKDLMPKANSNKTQLAEIMQINRVTFTYKLTGKRGYNPFNDEEKSKIITYLTDLINLKNLNKK